MEKRGGYRGGAKRVETSDSNLRLTELRKKKGGGGKERRVDCTIKPPRVVCREKGSP